ncbi:MAG: hypothetical protein VW552_00245 [Ilumatobacter sp.]
MRELFRHLHDHDGVATCDDLRRYGISWHRERRLLDIGVLDRVSPRVVRVTSTPQTFRQRCRIATLGPGRGVISHGAAARLHRLDGFTEHDRVDLLCRRGSWPGHPGVVITHFTRGPVDEAVVSIDGIPVLDIPDTLTLLSPHTQPELLQRAVISALARGWTLSRLRDGAERWTSRGRPGPRALTRALDNLGDGPVTQASIGANISSAAVQGSTRRSSTSSVSSSHRSPVHT